MVLVNGHPTTFGFLNQALQGVNALLIAGRPGEEAGNAVADLIFGKVLVGQQRKDVGFLRWLLDDDGVLGGTFWQAGHLLAADCRPCRLNSLKKEHCRFDRLTLPYLS